MTTQTLHIRYANPDTTPSTYGTRNCRSGVVTVNDYWTLRGEDYALRAHIERALQANNLNDYYFAQEFGA
jgi:hypothetical protein